MKRIVRSTVFFVSLGVSPWALADQAGNTVDSATKKAQQPGAPADPNAGADNTGRNKRDRNPGEPTADQQPNSKADLQLTARIRRSVMADKSLSTDGHNVKIIVENGSVTLKGPVSSEREKKVIADKAMAAAGQKNVKDEIEVKH